MQSLVLQETPNKTDGCWGIRLNPPNHTVSRDSENKLCFLFLFNPHIWQVELFESSKGKACPHHLLTQTCSTVLAGTWERSQMKLSSPIIKTLMLLWDYIKERWSFMNKLNSPCKQHTKLRTAWAEGTVKQKSTKAQLMAFVPCMFLCREFRPTNLIRNGN